MSPLDNLTKEKIETKVDMVFKDIRNAKTPEEIVPLLVELSEFIDRENLTSEQLDELQGMGARAMAKHRRMEILNSIGVVISIATASVIAGSAITIIYYTFTTGIENATAILLAPLAMLPIYLLYYGKTRKWFSE